MGPFPSWPILGSIRGEETPPPPPPPTNPNLHLKKERSELPLEWLLKEDWGRGPIVAAAVVTTSCHIPAVAATWCWHCRRRHPCRRPSARVAAAMPPPLLRLLHCTQQPCRRAQPLSPSPVALAPLPGFPTALSPILLPFSPCHPTALVPRPRPHLCLHPRERLLPRLHLYPRACPLPLSGTPIAPVLAPTPLPAPAPMPTPAPHPRLRPGLRPPLKRSRCRICSCTRAHANCRTRACTCTPSLRAPWQPSIYACTYIVINAN